MNQFDVIYSSTLNSIKENTALPPNLVKTVNALSDLEHGDLLTALPLIKKGVALNDKQQAAVNKFLAGVFPINTSTQTSPSSAKAINTVNTSQPAPTSGTTVNPAPIGT